MNNQALNQIARETAAAEYLPLPRACIAEGVLNLDLADAYALIRFWRLTESSEAPELAELVTDDLHGFRTLGQYALHRAHALLFEGSGAREQAAICQQEAHRAFHRLPSHLRWVKARAPRAQSLLVALS